MEYLIGIVKTVVGFRGSMLRGYKKEGDVISEQRAKKYGVCDLKYAQKLKELGFKQESLWYWVVYVPLDIHETGVCLRSNKEIENLKGFGKHYSAFTVAELGEKIKCANGTDSILPFYGKRIKKWIKDFNNEKCPLNIRADTEADARAEQLIYLRENKLI